MGNTYTDNISDTIKRVRKGKKLSQREFAEKLEVNIKTVQNWEYKYVSPSRTNVQTVIDKFALKEEDYPDLFEYISHPRAKDKANEQPEVTESATTESETAAKCDEDELPIFKRIFNTPVKTVVISVAAIILSVGVFFGFSLMFQFIDEGYSYTYHIAAIIISIACTTAVIIAVLLVFHFLPPKKAVISALTIILAVEAFLGCFLTLNYGDVTAGRVVISAAACLASVGAVLLLKHFLPIKDAAVIAFALIVAFGVFIGVYFILICRGNSSDSTKAMISVGCAVVVVAAMLLVYFLIIKRRKK